MKQILTSLCLTFAVLLGSAGVSWSNETNTGPSFDCDKASTATEYAICASDDLSALDRVLADAYKIAKGLDNSTTLRDEQRQWNKERSSTCGDDVECLSRMYQERIKVLCGDDGECLSCKNIQGSFRGGKKHGLWVKCHDNGQLQRKGTYKYGKKEGPWVSYWEHGKLYEKGTYKDGKKHGPYEHYYDNGQLKRKGTYKDGKKHGPYETYYDNGQLEEKGTYKDGKKHGPWEYYDYDGQLRSKKTYKMDGTLPLDRQGYSDELDGPYEYYYENGQLSSKGTFKNDERDGPWVWYYENGQLDEKGTYKDGEKEGPYEYYYENGQLHKKGTYKDGYRDGAWEDYYNNGLLDKKGTYKDGKKHGPYETYYDNGQLDEKGTYSYGEKEGPWEEYDNGKLKRIETYNYGVREGPWEEYHDNGQLWKKGTYKNDFWEGLREVIEEDIKNLKPAQKALIESIPIKIIKDFNSKKPVYQGIFIDKVCGPYDNILSMEDGDRCFDFDNEKVGTGCLTRRIYPSGKGDILRYGPWITFDGELEFYKGGGSEEISISEEQKFSFFFCSEDNEITEKAYNLAIREFSTLAKQGDANAQYKLGFMYQRGLGVDSDYEIAAEWYKKSAQQGNINAKKTQCIMCEDFFGYWSGDEETEYQKNYCKSVNEEDGFCKTMN